MNTTTTGILPDEVCQIEFETLLNKISPFNLFVIIQVPERWHFSTTYICYIIV